MMSDILEGILEGKNKGSSTRDPGPVILAMVPVDELEVK
jgi:hypothetical protein